jgi:hypothetical protein
LYVCWGKKLAKKYNKTVLDTPLIWEKILIFNPNKVHMWNFHVKADPTERVEANKIKKKSYFEKDIKD